MRKSKQCTLSDLLCVFLVLFLFVGCIKGQRAPTIYLPRGITGLELGMTPEQIGQLFTIKEDIDPVAAFLIKYGEPGKGEKLSQQNQALQKQFFRISSGIGKLPEGVTSADVHTTHKIVYQIGLHYDETSVKKVGWQGITDPYIAKYGKPTKDIGSGYIWDDARTRLHIDSGSIIHIIFSDQTLKAEVEKSERENP